MKIIVPFLALVLRVAAEPHFVVRDAGAVSAIMSSVLTGLKTADSALLAYSGDSPKALHEASHNLIATIKKQTHAAKAMTPLAFEDIKAIAHLSCQVSKAGATYWKDLAGAKGAFEAAGICTHLYEFSTKLGAATNEFFATVLTKFPKAAQHEAEEHILESQRLFAATQAALAPSVCVNKVAPPHAPGDEDPCPGGHGHSGAPGHEGNSTKGRPPSSVDTAGGSLVGVSGGALVLAAAAAAAALVL